MGCFSHAHSYLAFFSLPSLFSFPNAKIPCLFVPCFFLRDNNILSPYCFRAEGEEEEDIIIIVVKRPISLLGRPPSRLVVANGIENVGFLYFFFFIFAEDGPTGGWSGGGRRSKDKRDGRSDEREKHARRNATRSWWIDWPGALECQGMRGRRDVASIAKAPPCRCPAAVSRGNDPSVGSKAIRNTSAGRMINDLRDYYTHTHKHKGEREKGIEGTKKKKRKNSARV